LDSLPGQIDIDDPPNIVATKAFTSAEEADAEIERMNALSTSKGSKYFWRIARLERKQDAI